MDFWQRKAAPLKLWLLDADIIIDFLSMGIFEILVKNHKVQQLFLEITQTFYKKRTLVISPKSAGNTFPLYWRHREVLSGEEKSWYNEDDVKACLKELRL